MTAPISPTARANAIATPERMPGRMLGSTIRRKTVISRAPSERAASSICVSSSSSTGCTVRTTNGSVTKSSTRIDRGAREGDVDADRRARAVEREHQEAGDDRRQRERQVDDRVDERLAAEVVAHEHPGDDRPEDGVRERDERGDGQRQLERGDRLRRGDPLPEAGRALRARRPDERRDRQRDDDRQEGRDKAEGEGRSGPLPRAT